jgi:transcriptional regulator with GAF, ATPase, and Fis domain
MQRLHGQTLTQRFLHAASATERSSWHHGDMAETELDPALDQEHASLGLQLKERDAALAEAERRIRALSEEVEQLRSALAAAQAEAKPAAPPPLLTADDLVRLERDNLVRALEASGWQVAGENGAARRLGVAPSTFTSRMKALGVRRQP